MGRREDVAPPGSPGGTAERPAVFFRDAAEFRSWLELHHATETELWMGLRAKHVSPRGLTWAEAVPEALCFGWIDSLSQRIDDDARRQRWTPRKPGSTWSAVNVAHVERLLAEGRMRPAGIAAFEARRDDRTAIYSYEGGSLELPRELQQHLDASAPARAFLDAATAGYRRAALSWVLGAKREATREQRVRQLVDDSAAGRLIPPQRYGETPRWVERAAAAAAAAAEAAP
ncbi:YdeI family protein [Agrococcus sp. HG114]|uniref:YdeI/OmpD-associated family protein n=1 Tax=Agrococcus sp. HG114 TaxID=2969757 RepID=UPI00215A6460|nr:YdeI/OmpD-associated family protein [Agrococcus sp. HG114]MCR8671577.1 YdeI/OmpD-associated family protein [Agrococcus sp. HG114]